jgi:Icc-related predicted phosphoesterase
MKILYSTDLHGNAWKYKRFLEAARDIKPDVVINGGDMLPNDNNLFRQKEYISCQLNEHFNYFDEKDIPYLCFPGNDDLAAFDKHFEETCRKHSCVRYLAQKIVVIQGYEFMGMNWVVDFPFLLKDRCRKDTGDYKVGYQKGQGVFSREDHFENIPDWKTCIDSLPTLDDELFSLPIPCNRLKTVYVMHMPPANLGLDHCMNGDKVGSKAIHAFIKAKQPLLTLHGHIHESPDVSGIWHARLGETLCIQPGQYGQMEGFVYVVLDMKNMSCERFVV